MKITLKKSLIIALLAACGAIGWVAASGRFDRSENRRPTVSVAVNDAPLERQTKFTTSFAPVVKKVAPSVVNVFTTKTVRNPMPEITPFFDDPFFRRFFGSPFGDDGGRRQPRTFKERSLGSGVIVTKDGYILTNNHVVDGADEIKVARDKDKKKFTAKVVGRDPRTDIAVLKIDAKDLPSITFADSDRIEVGDVVLALGNPFGIGQTVTMGIVSATGRGGMGIEDYEDFIQTDAAINPGNSGGALVDAEGRLIGVNTAILSRTGGNQGVGFAIPINMACYVMDRITREGKVTRGYLGINPQSLTIGLAKEFNLPDDSSGVMVGGVMPGTAAEKAGLKNGDVILEINGKKMTDPRTLQLLVAQMSPGTKVTLRILRSEPGKAPMEKTLTATLIELPQEAMAGRSRTSPTEHGRSSLDAPEEVEVTD